jgi:hypothetical protein
MNANKHIETIKLIMEMADRVEARLDDLEARIAALEPTATQVWVDPPSGWKYGFPKQAPQEATLSRTTLNTWLFDNGYPLVEIRIWAENGASAPRDQILDNACVPCRMWQ